MRAFISGSDTLRLHYNIIMLARQCCIQEVSFKIMVAEIKLQQFHQLILNFPEAYDNMQSNKP